MHLLGREPQRRKSHHDQAHIAHDAGQAHFGARNVEHHGRLPETAEQHQPHHRAQQRKVDLAVKANRAAVGRGVGLEQLFAAVVVPAIEREEDSQQRTDEEQGFGEDVAHRPEKVHALQEAQEQRRIAQRRERAPGVGDDEDEEHHHMGHMLAVVVGADQRANEQHGRARGAHEAGQHRTNRQDGRVEPRAAVQVAADEDAARHSEQRGEQDHERDVFGQQRMHQAHARHCGPEGDGKGQQKRQAPGRSHLAKVVVPEDGGQERHERNRQQDARERHTPQHRQRAAIYVGSHAQAWQQGPGGGHPRRSAARNLHGVVSINALCHQAGPGALRCGAKNHWGFTGVQGCRTPGAGRRGIFRHRTCPCRGCLTAWPPAGRCSGSS